MSPHSGLGRAAQTLVLQRLHQARRDPLTDTWTRESFTMRGERVLARQPACLVILADINDFKGVNDRLGREGADSFLVKIAALLRDWSGPSGQVGRLGGDEFAAIRVLAEDENPDELVASLRAVLECDETTVGGRSAGAAVGATVTFRGDRLAAALACADVALYAAKQDGGEWSLRVPGRGHTELDRPRRYKRTGRQPAVVRQRPAP
ncbi:MAG: GGDEF domain-containing protein [Angustibacter sp.]